VGDEVCGLRAAFLADTVIYYATNVIFMAGKGEHMMVRTVRLGCENMPKTNRRKDMPKTDMAVNQMLSDAINKIDKVLDGAYVDTHAKYANGKASSVAVVGLTTSQMNNMKTMLKANIDYMDDVKQTATVDNRIAKAKRVIGRIDDYMAGRVTDTNRENAIMTKTMIAKAKADRKAKQTKVAEYKAQLEKAGLSIDDLMDL